jgi:four helix bundle protein
MESPGGTSRALAGDVAGVRDFRDLVCWRLSNELKCEIWQWSERGPVSRDFKYRDQIRDSSASAPGNISEGFGRFSPAEFALFLKYARASLMETVNHLIDARQRGYIADPLYSRLMNLARAARRLTTRLMLSKLRQASTSKRRRTRRPPPAAKPPSTL